MCSQGWKGHKGDQDRNVSSWQGLNCVMTIRLYIIAPIIITAPQINGLLNLKFLKNDTRAMEQTQRSRIKQKYLTAERRNWPTGIKSSREPRKNKYKHQLKTQ